MSKWKCPRCKQWRREPMNRVCAACRGEKESEMKVRVSIARSQREYADVIVEAESVEAAQAHVQTLLESTDDNDAYCDMVNRVSWQSGDETFDQTVIDAEEHEDEDEEADVVVPAAQWGFQASSYK